MSRTLSVIICRGNWPKRPPRKAADTQKDFSDQRHRQSADPRGNMRARAHISTVAKINAGASNSISAGLSNTRPSTSACRGRVSDSGGREFSCAPRRLARPTLPGSDARANENAAALQALRRGFTRGFPGLGGAHDVADLDDVGGTDDQPVADAVEGLEDEHRAAALIRQLHLLGPLAALGRADVAA